MFDLMHFEAQLTTEEILIQNTVAAFVQDQVMPVITSAFEQAQFPQQWIAKLAELGLLGMTLPTAYGGSDAGAVSYGLVCQELERGDSGLRSFVSVQSCLCMYPIVAFGSEQQKQTWLPKLAQAQCIGCFGLTEADAGSDPASMRTHAQPVSDGWILNGSKTWITNAPLADIAIVWAKTSQGIRGFIVELTQPGVTVNEIHHKLSMRASSTGELTFNDCWVPAESLLPGSDIGLVAALKCLTQARFGIAWGAMGAARACFEIAREYALTRTQFGRPIAATQLIQQDLVTMYTELSKAQWLNLQLARLKDQNQLDPVAVSMAKRNACQQALMIARRARHILGGNGISLEYHVIRHLANLETVYTYEGTDNIHTLIVGKYLTNFAAF
ncbi:MAG: acyl-CoA dehydrogenase [Legionellales bacterium]|nr:acyl-CoA dehydrogenase [Legionellales bacterium]